LSYTLAEVKNVNGKQIVTALPTIAVVIVAAGAGSDSSAAVIACRGTPPNHVASGPPFSRSQFNYGGANLRAHLVWKNGWLKAGILPDGGAMATINDDGSIYTKQGWWRGKRGTLVVTGLRLGGGAPSMRGVIRPGYAETGFIPVGLTFPTTGCWRITGTLGESRLTYVVKVTKLQP
jgi:hypothetical protein